MNRDAEPADNDDDIPLAPDDETPVDDELADDERDGSSAHD